MIELKIMGHVVVIRKANDTTRIDLSNIPANLAWWKPVVLDYLEMEGFI